MLLANSETQFSIGGAQIGQGAMLFKDLVFGRLSDALLVFRPIFVYYYLLWVILFQSRRIHTKEMHRTTLVRVNEVPHAINIQ